ncbi:MAG: hypothetical protein Q8R26_04005 [bacterium]|nr:hypothetical protein [bacterium]
MFYPAIAGIIGGALFAIFGFRFKKYYDHQTTGQKNQEILGYSIIAGLLIGLAFWLLSPVFGL